MNELASTARILDADRLILGSRVKIDEFAVIGRPNPYPSVFENDEQRRIIIGDDVVIGCFAIVYEGARLCERVRAEERCLVGSRTIIGADSRLMYGAQVHDNVVVGQKTFIAGFVADNCRVGSRCHVFGSLIHCLGNPDHDAWDITDENGPVLEDGVIIGWGAIIIGPVTIGAKARIKPGTVVRDSVPSGATL